MGSAKWKEIPGELEETDGTAIVANWIYNIGRCFYNNDRIFNFGCIIRRSLNCPCHGKAVAEVKYPFKHVNYDIRDAALQVSSFIFHWTELDNFLWKGIMRIIARCSFKYLCAK